MNATTVTPPRTIARRDSRASGNPVGHCWASQQWHPARTLAATALILLLTSGGATAQTNWQAGTGDWLEPSHWTSGVPTSSIDATIDNGGTAQIASPGARALDVFVGRELPDPSLLEITGGGTLANRYGYLGYEFGSQGTATVSGSGSKWTNSTSFIVGCYGTGTLIIADGAQMSNGGGFLGHYSNSQGSATVTGAGSKWTNYDELLVGNYGTGMLIIADEGQLSSVDGYLGRRSGSHGTATVTGDGSKWTNSSWFVVGELGTGILNIQDGGEVSCANGFLGRNVGSHGTAVVTGEGAKWTNSSSLYVGIWGTGTLTVSDGGLVTAQTLLASIGDLFGNGTIVSNGAVLDTDLLFDGAHGTAQTLGFGTGASLNLDLDGSGSLGAGYKASGTLTVTGGVEVVSSFGYLGFRPGSQGIATVAGSGSTWTNSFSLTVGRDGTGTLTIEDGGQITSLSGSIGYSSGSHGISTVTGSGSTWTNSSNLHVGERGTGTLNIADGGQVSNTGGNLGRLTNSQGVGTVTGSGSKWTNSSTLHVGYNGVGTLRIADGGTVSAMSVSINSNSLLTIDIGQGSVLRVGSTGTGTITNNGTVRLLAGADVNAGATYAPIAAGTWSGTGSYVGVGGTWNAASRRFIASEVEHGASGAPILIDLAQRQRALVDDGPTGWSLGASFRAKTGAATQLTFTATAASGSILDDLIDLIEPGQIVWGAWELSAAGSGYSAGDPVYLSFDVGEGFLRSDLNLWRHDGLQWSPFSAPDLSYNGQYASFTVTSFSAYAVAAVPEPATWAMLLAALLGLTVRHRRRKR